MIRNRLIYAAALIYAVVFFMYYDGWFSLYLLIFTLCLPVLSLLFSLSAMKSFSLSAELLSFCTRGDRVRVFFINQSKNASLTPCYRFQIVMTEVMSGKKTVIKARLSGPKRNETTVCTEHCGTYRFDFGRCYVYDYSGLFRMRFKPPQSVSLSVFPRPVPPEPLPSLTRFQSRSYRPKYGGGFSEIHDMRPYRPGDSMRDIHWKLSTKIDQLIVREPQEHNRGLILLTLDLIGTQDELDGVFEQLAWLSGWLIAHEVTHEVHWVDPISLGLKTASIDGHDGLHSLMVLFFKTSLSPQTPSIAGRTFEAAEWRYHILPLSTDNGGVKRVENK